MANRVLRDYTASEKINNISYQAEVLFVRIMMKADDYGSFHANIKLLKSQCFPLRTDTVRDADISRWLDELQTSGLIVVYTHAGKQYLRIIDFGQRLRNMRNCFPQPINNNSQQFAATCGNPPPETKRNETEEETETEKNVFVNEKFLVPEMMREWKILFKKYPEKKENDFPALLQIAQFISEKEKIDCDIGIMPAFKILASYISTHDFYKNYSLLQVSRNIQSIVINISNGQSNSKNKQQATGANVSTGSILSKINAMSD